MNTVCENDTNYCFSAEYNGLFEKADAPVTAVYAEAVSGYLREMEEVRTVSRHGEQVFA